MKSGGNNDVIKIIIQNKMSKEVEGKNTVVINVEDGAKSEKSVISKTSKTSKTSKQSKNSSTAKPFTFKCNTCFGVIELTSVKLSSLFGMSITILAFTVVAAIMIASYILQGKSDVSVLIDRGELQTARETMELSAKLAFYSDTPALYLTNYYAAQRKLITIYSKLLQTQDYIFDLVSQFNLTESALALEARALTLLTRGRKAEGFALINSTQYAFYVEDFKNTSALALTYLLDFENTNQQNMMAITLVGLIVVLLATAIVLPVMVGIFIFSIDREGVQLERLKAANALMLIDTMNNQKLRELFKKHCEEEHSTENFKFLEKTTLYKSLCEQSFEIQEKLYGSDSNNTELTETTSGISGEDSHKSTGSGNNNNNKSKRKEQLEKDLRQVEKSKYELAFDIYTDYLDLNGTNSVNISKSFIEEVKTQLDYFNKGESEVLAEALFDNAAREISIVMLDTHQRFKSSLAFQKQMKIQNIKKKAEAH